MRRPSVLNSPPRLIGLFSNLVSTMLKQFIVQCLFFQSEEKMHKIFGALSWFSISLFVYAVVNLVQNWH